MKKFMRPKEMNITCPSCGKSFSLTLESEFLPEKRDTIFSNDMGLVTCPGCGKSFNLNYPLSYIDPDLGLFFVNDPKLKKREGILAFKTALKILTGQEDLAGFTVVLSGNIDELREKILIFEEGLDDRLVEILKILLPESPDFKIKKEDIGTISLSQEGNFLIKGKKDYSLPFPKDFYEELKEKYGEILGKRKIEVVDRGRALEFLSENRN